MGIFLTCLNWSSAYTPLPPPFIEQTSAPACRSASGTQAGTTRRTNRRVRPKPLGMT
ncbi:MAG: hypothetical protein ABSB78_03335 [Bacteroidota bacterium]